MRRAVAILGATLLGLAGCASDPARLPLGTSRAEALQQLGTPTAVYLRPGGGERLQYSRQPAGFEVNDVDLDASGRVVAVTQAMNEGLFGRAIRTDAWRVPDVLYTYGRPEQITRVSSFDGDVWQWRYLQSNSPRLLYIYIDPQGVVRRWHVGDDLRVVPGNLGGDRD
ncbi:MAG: hypothetical protein DI563_10380 [Variovorax paradoxus]|uniref:Lipoprotein transmembrane n=1 Tax=Variovorax paradoxus TaxID=34073 RepID=A0A2W5RXD5_VARPD|nr:MAG: hypothetical protein DI563_10380 [Variovorax paradoxus]